MYLPQQILIEFGARVILYQLGGVARASFTPSPWGVLKRVNLVNFFLQADSISFKGIYPGYKNEKLKKNAIDP